LKNLTKKLSYFLLLFILTSIPTIAIESNKTINEVIELDVVEEQSLEKSIKPENTVLPPNEKIKEENYFKDKLTGIYNLEVERTDVPSFLLKDLTTVEIKDGPIESLHFWGGYIGNLNMNFGQDEYLKYKNNTIQMGFDGKFRNNVADFRVLFDATPITSDVERSFMQNFLADVYVGTNKIPHHRLMIGNMRPRVGMEGGESSYLVPLVARSQVARTFGTARKRGIKLKGDWDLIEYELGGYSSDTYFHSFFPGAEFTGWVNLKPLGKTDGKWGELLIGGGLSTGKNDISYTVTGGYISYTYKKASANFECMQANGYNGAGGISENKADGFAVTVKYDLTPKLQLLARYDQFNPNKDISGLYNKEYTAGINYFVKGQALRLKMNYVFCQNNYTVDSHRIIVATQVML